MIPARIQDTLFIVQIQGLSSAIWTFRMYCADLEACTITSMQSLDYVHTRSTTQQGTNAAKTSHTHPKGINRPHRFDSYLSSD